jgi:hypothetical protein
MPPKDGRIIKNVEHGRLIREMSIHIKSIYNSTYGIKLQRKCMK